MRKLRDANNILVVYLKRERPFKNSYFDMDKKNRFTMIDATEPVTLWS